MQGGMGTFSNCVSCAARSRSLDMALVDLTVQQELSSKRFVKTLCDRGVVDRPDCLLV